MDNSKEQGVKRSISPETSGDVSPTKKVKLELLDSERSKGEPGASTWLDSEKYSGHTSSPASNASGDTIHDPSLNEPDSIEVDNAQERNGTDDMKLDSNSNRVIIETAYRTTNFVSKAADDLQSDKVENKGLLENGSIIRDLEIISTILPDVDCNTISNMLLDNQNHENRLDLVVSKLLEPGSNSVHVKNGYCSGLMKVDGSITQVSKAEVNGVVPESLPSYSTSTDTAATQHLTETNAEDQHEDTKEHLVKKNSSFIDDPFLAKDPLFRDMRVVSKMFPTKDQNEIYALLEANYNKIDRIQLVINEILAPEYEAGGRHYLANENRVATPEDPVVRDVERVKSIFPDCDPNYIFEELCTTSDADKVDKLVSRMFETKNYPKLKDLEEQAKDRTRKMKAKNLNLTVEEFLQIFPEPVKSFGDINKEVSILYRNLADVVLKNDFPMMRASFINSVLKRHNGHLYPAYQEISAYVIQIPYYDRAKYKKFHMSKKRIPLTMPTDVDEYFYHELWFTRNERNILDYHRYKEEERKENVEKAKLAGALYECCCCFDDELLFDELASCPDGHLFCRNCVIRSAEAAFGEMKVIFPCLTGGCDQNISINTLQTVLPSNLFSKILRRIQEEEVLKANIPDLVTCPFCPFATIMPNPDDKVLKCLNPDCLKESCRLCQEQNHIPLRCNEVEKKAETDMRTYIENAISEAVMRKCHRCGKKFVKETGCNKMTCVCGATSCYACKAQNIDYSHFNNLRCANTNVHDIHQKDMEEAAQRAKAQYLQDHPEAADLELKTDLDALIKNVEKKSGKGRTYNYEFQPVNRFYRVFNLGGLEIGLNGIRWNPEDDGDSDTYGTDNEAPSEEEDDITLSSDVTELSEEEDDITESSDGTEVSEEEKDDITESSDVTELSEEEEDDITESSDGTELSEEEDDNSENSENSDWENEDD